ncbi:MAG: hypothetical protein EOS34_20895 [Mesorhizobium sp.]|nr:MAG: hypothetical protein EOS34_20895 [Mesorhizobium sp.]
MGDKQQHQTASETEFAQQLEVGKTSLLNDVASFEDHVKKSDSTGVPRSDDFLSAIQLAKSLYGSAGSDSNKAGRFELDIFTAISINPSPFSPLHIEPLLDQARDLLGQCLADRKSYAEMEASAVQIALELKEFEDTDAIHEQERLSGAYTVPRDRAWKEMVADYATLQGAEQAERSLFQGGSNLVFLLETSGYYGGWYAKASSGPAYATDEQTPEKKYQFTLNDKVVFDGVRSDVLRDLSIAQAEIERVPRTNFFWASYYQAVAATQAAKLKHESSTLNYNYLDATVETKEARLTVARAIFLQKTQAFIEPGGVLNYRERSRFARGRFVTSLMMAYQRLSASAQGMSEIYGFPIPLPSPQTWHDIGGDVPDSFVDDCWLWLQEASNFLTIQQRQEQNTIVRLSLRSLIGDGAFGSDKSRWQFDVTENEIPDAVLIRCRGIGLATIGPTHAVGLRIRPPKVSEYQDIDGSVRRYDPATSTDVRSGRVLPANDIRDPDIIGVVHLHNRSPLGQWSIELIGPKPQSGQPISDILVDIHIAFHNANSK